MSLKRGNGKRDVDRKWDGREDGIKQRGGLQNQKTALVSLREEGAENDLLLGLWQEALMYALPVWHFLSLQEHFGSCLPAPLCLAGEAKSGIWKRRNAEII